METRHTIDNNPIRHNAGNSVDMYYVCVPEHVFKHNADTEGARHSYVSVGCYYHERWSLRLVKPSVQDLVN